MRLFFVSFYRKKRVGWLLPQEQTGSASASAEVSDLETDVDRETQFIFI